MRPRVGCERVRSVLFGEHMRLTVHLVRTHEPHLAELPIFASAGGVLQLKMLTNHRMAGMHANSALMVPQGLWRH